MCPNHQPGSPDAMASELGLRSVVFDVDDLQAIVDRLTMCAAAIGMGLVTTQVLPWVYRRGANLTVLPGPRIRQ
jgi:hypothetical protein